MAGDYENGGRRRPEDIVADAFLEHVPESATLGWSVRSRRLILLAMAVAGAVMVAAGLVLTGTLGPAPGHPRPIQAGPDASVLARSLLRPLADQQEPTTTTASGTPLPTAQAPSPVRAPVAAGILPTTPGPIAPAPTSQPTKTDQTQPTPSTTSTTRPCPLVAQQLSTAVQLPPLCP